MTTLPSFGEQRDEMHRAIEEELPATALQVFADGGIVQVRHHRDVVGGLQGESEPFTLLACGTLPRRGQRSGRKPGKPRLVFDDHFEGVGGIQDIFAEFRSLLRQFDIDRFKAFFARGVEIGAVAAEGLDGFVQVAAAFSGQFARFAAWRRDLPYAPRA